VHTFSHDAKNLTLDAKPGGCFCERLPDGGGVQQMSVVYASTNKLLRLTGAIGPLQEAALTGTMTWNLSPAGDGTTVELTYTVGGFRGGGLRDLPQSSTGCFAASWPGSRRSSKPVVPTVDRGKR
jgi:hypothetical protein